MPRRFVRPGQGPWPTRQRGLSVIALMVGLAVGLIISAAAVAAMAQQAGATRRLLRDARLTQELRVATELTTRHLRRARHWREADRAVWHADTAASSVTRPAPVPNPHELVVESADPPQWRFAYSSPANDSGDASEAASNDAFGLRLRDGTVELAIGHGQWQALTDRRLLNITSLQLRPREQRLSLAGFCALPCAPAQSACPPVLQVLDVAVRIEAEAVDEPRVHRVATSHVRVRNDALTGRCAS